MTEIISEAGFQELGKASRRAGLLSVLGFLIVLGALGYASAKLAQLEQQRNELEHERKRLAESVQQLQSRTQELLQTQAGVLDFLGGVTSSDQFRLIDRSVDWPQTRQQILGMESGPRKTAILTAILLAWKELPFSLSNRSLSAGLDSPHFIYVVLSMAGVRVEQKPGERLSAAMMRQFEMVDSPLPGDLIFYRGNVGSFVVMYIGPGSPEGKGVALGTLQTGEEVMILDTKNINTPIYPFIGFFRVPYPPEPER